MKEECLLLVVVIVASSSLLAGSNGAAEPFWTNDGERASGDVEVEGDGTAAAAAAAAAETYLVIVGGINELLLNGLRRGCSTVFCDRRL